MTKVPLLLAALAATACAASAAESDRDSRPLGAIRWSIDEAGRPASQDRVQLSLRTGSRGEPLDTPG